MKTPIMNNLCQDCVGEIVLFLDAPKNLFNLMLTSKSFMDDIYSRSYCTRNVVFVIRRIPKDSTCTIVRNVRVRTLEMLSLCLENCKDIYSLNIVYVNIKDEGAKVIGIALEKNTSLQTLDLTSNEIGNDGAQVIMAALKKNTTLQTLNWEYRKVRGIEKRDIMWK